MDTRAPVEYGKGAFPMASNLPLMTDAERAKVGTCYKQQGQQAAIDLGYRLVAGETLESRMQGWLDFADKHPDGYLYCFRGGLRSQLVQQAMAGEGFPYPRVNGGYKALRGFLIRQLEGLAKSLPWLVIAGRTGAGKTRLLRAFANSIDLEDLANHKGSTFGKALSPQPSQIDFENALAIRMLKQSEHGFSNVLIEDESHLIGRCAVPLVLRESLQRAPILLLDKPMELRVRELAEEYVLARITSLRTTLDLDLAIDKFRRDVIDNLQRIQRRLGGARYQKMVADFQAACGDFLRLEQVELFYPWIEQLLVEYYDPMYDYQLRRQERTVAYQGSFNELQSWLAGTGFST